MQSDSVCNCNSWDSRELVSIVLCNLSMFSCMHVGFIAHVCERPPWQAVQLEAQWGLQKVIKYQRGRNQLVAEMVDRTWHLNASSPPPTLYDPPYTQYLFIFKPGIFIDFPRECLLMVTQRKVV